MGVHIYGNRCIIIVYGEIGGSTNEENEKGA